MTDWRLVPVEATCAMQAAWNAAEDGGWDAAHAAYIAAAPAPNLDTLAADLWAEYSARAALIPRGQTYDPVAILAAALRAVLS